MGRIRQLLVPTANGCFQRNLAVALRSGEGPLTIRFADFRCCAVQASGLVSYDDLRLGKPPERELCGDNNSEQLPIRPRYRL